MIPLIVGAGMAAGGLASMYASSKKKVAKATPQTYVAPDLDRNAYQYGGSPDATARWRDEMAARDAAGLSAADAMGAQGQQARDTMADAQGRWRAMADGTGPSLARAQMQRGLAQASQAAAQQAASVSGGAANQLVAQRMAQQQGAQMRMEAAGRGAELAAQEQIAATGQLGALGAQMRAGDLAAQQVAEQRARDALAARMSIEQQQMQGQQAFDQTQAAGSRWQQEQQGAANAGAQQTNQARQQADKDKWWNFGVSTVGAGANTAIGGIGKGGGK